MGLDITAYSKVELIDTSPNYDAYWEKYGQGDSGDLDYVYDNPYFPERMPPIVADGVYKIHGDRFSFRAGSYSGYGQWRSELAELALGVPAGQVWANRAGFAGCAFYELVDFSDCEGVIGTVACVKLAADFDRFQAKADQHEEAWFREKYAAWRKAFELAANDGFVRFH